MVTFEHDASKKQNQSWSCIDEYQVLALLFVESVSSSLFSLLSSTIAGLSIFQHCKSLSCSSPFLFQIPFSSIPFLAPNFCSTLVLAKFSGSALPTRKLKFRLSSSAQNNFKNAANPSLA